MIKKRLTSWLLILLIAFNLPTTISAETIITKSGQKIEGRIIERTDKYIKVDFIGVPLTYYFDEIESIDGQKPTFYISPTEHVVPLDQKCFLWKAQSVNNTVYILGSIHFAKKDLYPLHQKIEDAFNKSDILVVEADPNKNIDETRRVILKHALYSEGESLKENISKELFELIESKLAQLSVPVSSVERYKPWYLAMMLQELEFQRLGYYPIYGIDYYFLKKAGDRKPIFELESIESQINLLSGLSKYEQELNLYYTTAYLDKIEKEINELINAWLKGDEKEMGFLLIESSLLSDPRLLPLFEKIFYQRNKTMVNKIEESLKTKWTYFIVVGAGHLVGKEGIIELLKQKGYSVSQI